MFEYEIGLPPRERSRAGLKGDHSLHSVCSRGTNSAASLALVNAQALSHTHTHIHIHTYIFLSPLNRVGQYNISLAVLPIL